MCSTTPTSSSSNKDETVVGTDDPAIWHPNESSTDSITLYESRGNGFHLSAIVRKYTGARVTVKGRQQMVKIEMSKLYDALGLLRSLRYDVDQFNLAIGDVSKASDDAKDDNNGGSKRMSTAERKYACFRLSRQAAQFGVRLAPVTSDTTDPVLVPGLDSLIQYMEHHYQNQISLARSNVESCIVDFDSLQEYYTPGKVLVDWGVGTGVSMCPTLMKVRACYYSRGKSLLGIVSTFHVALECVVALGDGNFAVVEAQFPQSEFHGTRSVAAQGGNVDLFTQPSEELVKDVLKRGKTYQAICCGGTLSAHEAVQTDAPVTGAAAGSGVMVEYRAGTFLPTAKGSLHNKNTSSRTGSYGQASRSSGRIMVDTTSAWSRGVHPGHASGGACDAVVHTLRHYYQRRSAAAATASSSHASSAAAEYTTGATLSTDGDDSTDILILSSPLPSELLQLTWPVVPGFSLQARTWGVATVSGLSSVKFNQSAFDDLVMPAARKKLLRALVSSHDRPTTSTSSNKKKKKAHADVISGKGEGSIFLLHGPPGVGKTLTAEAMAELLQRPLYTVSMGELGTSPETLEDRLQDVLDLCLPWKALVLIDEAEMLLEKRTKHDVVRNAMVCVMLRLLEYYRGMLFLTTNRVESLDPAFQSRVTCALRYDALGKESRREIWRTALSRVGVEEYEYECGEGEEGIDLEELAECEMNGRQIKNALQMAVALADHEEVELSMEHLRTTLEITTSFLSETTKGEF